MIVVMLWNVKTMGLKLVLDIFNVFNNPINHFYIKKASMDSFKMAMKALKMITQALKRILDAQMVDVQVQGHWELRLLSIERQILQPTIAEPNTEGLVTT